MKRIYLIVIFILAYFLLVFSIYKDFGVTWDESDVYARGLALKNYLLGRVDYESYTKSDIFGTYYNHLYGLILALINKTGSFEAYHFLNLSFASLAFGASFVLFYSWYKNQVYAILGPLFLFLVPRFTGDIPANPKDSSFAVFYFTSLVGVFLLSKNRLQLARILGLGILFGISQSMRVIAFSLYPITFLFTIYSKLQGEIAKMGKLRLQNLIVHEVLSLILVFLIANFITVVTWPYLGSNYIGHLIEILATAKDFPWVGPVLFLGKQVSSTQLPWNYLPAWLAITTPIFILLFSATSVIFVKKILKNQIFFLFATALVINFALYIIIRPVLYDGLRHFLFLLPMIATIASLSFIEFFKNYKNKILKRLILVFTMLNTTLVVINLIRLHPYQYVYFNEFVGGLKGAYERFETDYYGASFKEAIEWLKENEIDLSRSYKINTCGHPVSSYYYFSEKMKWVEKLEEADYFICYTRFNQHKLVPESKTIYTVAREGVPLNFVKKLK